MVTGIVLGFEKEKRVCFCGLIVRKNKITKN